MQQANKHAPKLHSLQTMNFSDFVLRDVAAVMMVSLSRKKVYTIQKLDCLARFFP